MPRARIVNITHLYILLPLFALSACSSVPNLKIDYEQYSSLSLTSYIDEIPDLLQTTDSADFAGGGEQFCGPVAVSNSLVWLKKEQTESNQISLVHRLSGPDFMNTNIVNGTSNVGLIQGVDKYVTEEMGGYEQLEYSGWRECPSNYRSATAYPSLPYLLSGLNNRSAVWLNIGWYKTGSSKNVYQRSGGHWVTLVGYENGRLIIHDPDPRAGSDFQNELVEFSPLKRGTLVGNTPGLPAKAAGYFLLSDGMHLPKNIDAAILDGAVILKM